MTEEHKRALIEGCQRDILDLERDISRCDAIGTVDYLIHLQSRLERQQIALAALTAQQIKLPKVNHPAQFEYADKVANLLKNHNIKVQE